MSTQLDIGALSAAILSLSIYHAYAYGSVCLPSRSSSICPCIGMQLSRNIHNSSLWLEKHLRHDDASSDTAAIQTLRNAILVAIFIGGSSLTFAWNSLDAASVTSVYNEQIRHVIISTLLFCSFLNWANTIRYATHLGFIVGTLKLSHTEIIDAKVRRESKLNPGPAVDLETGMLMQDAAATNGRVRGASELPPAPLPPRPPAARTFPLFASRSRDEHDRHPDLDPDPDPELLERAFVKNQVRAVQALKHENFPNEH